MILWLTRSGWSNCGHSGRKLVETWWLDLSTGFIHIYRKQVKSVKTDRWKWSDGIISIDLVFTFANPNISSVRLQVACIYNGIYISFSTMFFLKLRDLSSFGVFTVTARVTLFLHPQPHLHIPSLTLTPSASPPHTFTLDLSLSFILTLILKMRWIP